jgi:hypothetical protein
VEDRRFPQHARDAAATIADTLSPRPHGYLGSELLRTPYLRTSENTPSTPGDGEGLPRLAHGPRGPTSHQVRYWARLAKRQHDGVSRR